LTNWYVRSGATGTANGADWTDAFTSVNTALLATTTLPGDVVWVSEDHSETFAVNVNIYVGNSTVSSPVSVLCANHLSLSTPPNVAVDLQTSANIISNGSISFSNGYVNWYGINFNSGSGVVTAQTLQMQNPGGGTGGHSRYNYCGFNLAGGSAASYIYAFSSGSSAAGYVEFNNCSFDFSNTGQFVAVSGFVQFDRCSFGKKSTILPNYLFYQTITHISTAGPAKFKACDFTAINTNLFGFQQHYYGTPFFIMEDCQINSTAAITNSNPTLFNDSLQLQINRTIPGSDEFFMTAYGTEQSSNTVFRNGGAHGVSNKSRNILTQNSATSILPFSTINPFIKWNDTVGSTIYGTIFGTWNGTAPPNNQQIWLEVEYFANATSQITNVSSSGLSNNNVYFPTGTLVTTTYPVDTVSTWANGGTNNFVISVPFTPQKAGYVRGYIKVGQNNIAAANLYIDPILYLTNSTYGALGPVSRAYGTTLGTINESGANVTTSSIIIQGL